MLEPQRVARRDQEAGTNFRCIAPTLPLCAHRQPALISALMAPLCWSRSFSSGLTCATLLTTVAEECFKLLEAFTPAVVVQVQSLLGSELPLQ